MSIKTYRDSIAWQKAMELTSAVYVLTRGFPDAERFGLTSQLRRAAVSIASNIAEGQGRLTTGEFVHFLGMARGSSLEVETQLELAKRLAYCGDEEVDHCLHSAEEVRRILNAVIRNLRQPKQNASHNE